MSVFMNEMNEASDREECGNDRRKEKSTIFVTFALRIGNLFRCRPHVIVDSVSIEITTLQHIPELDCELLTRRFLF